MAPSPCRGRPTIEGGLSRSLDGKFVVLGGYAANAGTANVAKPAPVNRAIARIDRSYTVNTNTKLTTAFWADSIRGACTSDGTTIWATGNGSSTTGGAWRTTFGTTGTGTQVVSNPSNARGCHVFLGQFYMSSGSSTLNTVLKAPEALPSTASQTATALSGLRPEILGPELVRAPRHRRRREAGPALRLGRAPAPTAGIYKWTSADGGATWTAGTPANVASSTGTRGLAGAFHNGVVTLYASTVATTNAIIKVVDPLTGAAATLTTIVTAGTNTAFRGIAIGVR